MFTAVLVFKRFFSSEIKRWHVICDLWRNRKLTIIWHLGKIVLKYAPDTEPVRIRLSCDREWRRWTRYTAYPHISQINKNKSTSEPFLAVNKNDGIPFPEAIRDASSVNIFSFFNPHCPLLAVALPLFYTDLLQVLLLLCLLLFYCLVLQQHMFKSVFFLFVRLFLYFFARYFELLPPVWNRLYKLSLSPLFNDQFSFNAKILGQFLISLILFSCPCVSCHVLDKRGKWHSLFKKGQDVIKTCSLHHSTVPGSTRVFWKVSLSFLLLMFLPCVRFRYISYPMIITPPISCHRWRAYARSCGLFTVASSITWLTKQRHWSTKEAPHQGGVLNAHTQVKLELLERLKTKQLLTSKLSSSFIPTCHFSNSLSQLRTVFRGATTRAVEKSSFSHSSKVWSNVTTYRAKR